MRCVEGSREHEKNIIKERDQAPHKGNSQGEDPATCQRRIQGKGAGTHKRKRTRVPQWMIRRVRSQAPLRRKAREKDPSTRI